VLETVLNEAMTEHLDHEKNPAIRATKCRSTFPGIGKERSSRRSSRDGSGD
jgi:hypothetical protein